MQKKYECKVKHFYLRFNDIALFKIVYAVYYNYFIF